MIFKASIVLCVFMYSYVSSNGKLLIRMETTSQLQINYTAPMKHNRKCGQFTNAVAVVIAL